MARYIQKFTNVYKRHKDLRQIPAVKMRIGIVLPKEGERSQPVLKSEGLAMSTKLKIKQEDFAAILVWESEGGPALELDYQLVSDNECGADPRTQVKERELLESIAG